MNRRVGIVRAATTLTVLVTASFVVQGVTLPGTAHARCTGEGNRVTLTLVVNGTTYVTEQADSDTCNGNGVYQGRLRSNVSGRRAVVLFRRDPDAAYQQAPGAATSWVNWQVSEPDSAFNIVLCSSDSRYTTCGIGSSYVTRPYGEFYTGIHVSNWGF
jgi:hypothetical protein